MTSRKEFFFAHKISLSEASYFEVRGLLSDALVTAIGTFESQVNGVLDVGDENERTPRNRLLASRFLHVGNWRDAVTS